jgi:hypothetical protein
MFKRALGLSASLTLFVAVAQEPDKKPSPLLFENSRHYLPAELDGLPGDGWIGIAKDGGRVGGWRCALVAVEPYRMQHYSGLSYLQTGSPPGTGPIEYVVHGLELVPGAIDCTDFDDYTNPAWVDLEHPNLWPTAREHYELSLNEMPVRVFPAMSVRQLQAVLQVGESRQTLFSLDDDQLLIGLEIPELGDFDRDGRIDVLVTVVTRRGRGALEGRASLYLSAGAAAGDLVYEAARREFDPLPALGIAP